MNKNPSASIRPMSPVLNHPSDENDSLVAFSLFQYPKRDCQLRQAQPETARQRRTGSDIRPGNDNLTHSAERQRETGFDVDNLATTDGRENAARRGLPGVIFSAG